LVEAIENSLKGLDPNVLSFYYRKIEKQARELCPDEELRTSIQVIQNPLLPMKFQIKSSRRAIPYIVRAALSSLDEMPFATRLYFEKFVEILQLELANYMKRQQVGSQTPPDL
jgi:hypothetical protein